MRRVCELSGWLQHHASMHEFRLLRPCPLPSHHYQTPYLLLDKNSKQVDGGGRLMEMDAASGTVSVLYSEALVTAIAEVRASDKGHSHPLAPTVLLLVVVRVPRVNVAMQGGRAAKLQVEIQNMRGGA